MPKKVKKSNVEEWLKLREEGHTYSEIQKTTGWNAETIRKHCEVAIAEKDKAKKAEAEKAKTVEGIDYAKIFTVFDESEDPTEVVKRGLCTPEQAKKALQDYLDLKDGTTFGQLDVVKTTISDLKFGQTALQERVKKLEAYQLERIREELERNKAEHERLIHERSQPPQRPRCDLPIPRGLSLGAMSPGEMNEILKNLISRYKKARGLGFT